MSDRPGQESGRPEQDAGRPKRQDDRLQAENPLDVFRLEPPIAPDALQRAYRDGVRTHPPERDPEGFRRIRQAYEALQSPANQARWALQRFAPPAVDHSVSAMPLAAAAPWWLARDPWSDLGRTDFSGDCRDPETVARLQAAHRADDPAESS